MCSDGFYDAGGSCQPKCGEWEGLPHVAIVITDVIVVFQAVVYTVSAAVVIILSCIQHQRMYVKLQHITDVMYLQYIFIPLDSSQVQISGSICCL